MHIGGDFGYESGQAIGGGRNATVAYIECTTKGPKIKVVFTSAWSYLISENVRIHYQRMVGEEW